MDFQKLSKAALFDGLLVEEIEKAVECLGGREEAYYKGETVFAAGEPAKGLGLVVLGSVQVQRFDIWGNQSILEHITPGQVFGEAYACLPDELMNVSVNAVEESKVLMLDAGRVLHPCSQGCHFHQRLLENLVKTMARKNLNLTRKMNHITHRTIRQRLMSYLSYQAQVSGSYTFAIPFDRQRLADYLSVDRSALSAELSRMQKEGMITYKKNRFILHGQGQNEA